MKLNKQTFKLYAANHYDNPFCFTVEEFEEDLSQVSVIKRLITNYMMNGQTNLRLLVNNVIGFYNVFEHHAATELIRFKLFDEQIPYINSILMFLSLPVSEPGEFDSRLLITIREEFK